MELRIINFYVLGEELRNFFFLIQNAWMYLTIGLIFIVGSSLLMHMVFFAEEFMWVPRHTKDTLFISAVSYLLLFMLMYSC